MKITIEPTDYRPDVKSRSKWILECDEPPHHTYHETIEETLMWVGVLMQRREKRDE